MTGGGVLGAWRDVPRLRAGRPGTTAYMRLRGGAPGEAWAAAAAVSPHAICAVVGAEDPDFFEHRGVCWGRAAARVRAALLRGGRIGGVSTLTQQLARNLYLHEGRSAGRKAQELLLARRLEAVLGKERLLELYLNVVEWGPGTWGIEGAAARYFGASAAALNPFQAVVLASLLPAPRAALAGRNLERALASQRRTLHFLYGAGVMCLLEWRETVRRLSLLADALRAGRDAGGVLREVGAPPYPEGGGAPPAAEVLRSRCGLGLRVAYTEMLHREARRPGLTARLPLRWNGELRP